MANLWLEAKKTATVIASWRWSQWALPRVAPAALMQPDHDLVWDLAMGNVRGSAQNPGETRKKTEISSATLDYQRVKGVDDVCLCM